MIETDGLLEFEKLREPSSIIKVLGVGGGGSNAVNHMCRQGIHGVDFIICNTDAQAIACSPVPVKIQLGHSLTAGNGAGSKPEVGKNATIENLEDIQSALGEETRMVFITAGMGGGTGTGGAPVIAKMAREMGILTIGIVTIPFGFEGRKRRKLAQEGIVELRNHVDTLLVINNDKLVDMHGDLELDEAFAHADNILTDAAKGIAEIITHVGHINVDFEDVKTVMKDSGVAIMGTGVSEGEHRALKAVEMALNSPLLNDNQIAGANDVLLYIKSGTKGIRLEEVTQITDHIQTEAGSSAEIIWGNGKDESLGESISVTIIATGFSTGDHQEATEVYQRKPGIVVGEVTDSNITTPIVQQRSQTTAEESIQVISRPAVEGNNNPPKEMSPHHRPHSDRHEDNKSEDTNNDHGENQGNNISAKKESPEKGTLTLTEDQHPEVQQKQNPEKPDNSGLSDAELKQKGRIDRLKELTRKLRDPDGLVELEVNPAYMRRKVNLSDQHHSSDSEVSKYTLNDGEITDNSYLHGGID